MKPQKSIMIVAFVFSIIFTGFYHLMFTYSIKNDQTIHKTLYMNQVGLFKKENTMKQLQKELKDNGIVSYTWKQGDTTAVVCYVSVNIDDTKNGQEKLKQLGINYIQKSAFIESKEVSKMIDDKKFQEVLERIAQ